MITHVAIKFDERIWSLPKPYRHHHIMHMIVNLSKVFGDWTGDCFEQVITHNEYDSGFLDDSGRFLNRKEAMVHARSLYQLNESPIYGDELFSENVW